MTRERVEDRSVSMYPSDWKIVEAADISGSGVSAAMRAIVRQWQKYIKAERHLAEHPEYAKEGE